MKTNKVGDRKGSFLYNIALTMLGNIQGAVK